MSSICRKEPDTQYLAWLSGIWPTRLSFFILFELVFVRIILSRLIRLIALCKHHAGMPTSGRWITDNGWSHQYRARKSVLMSVGVLGIEPAERIASTILDNICDRIN